MDKQDLASRNNERILHHIIKLGRKFLLTHGAFYVIVTHDLQKMAALLIGVIDWTMALGGG